MLSDRKSSLAAHRSVAGALHPALAFTAACVLAVATDAQSAPRAAAATAASPGRADAPRVVGGQPRAINQLTRAERAAGWRLLFDGATLGGWRGLGYRAVPAGHWVVVGGAIKKVATRKVRTQADGQPIDGGDLMTEAVYGDFELAWQWKVAPGANSGVKYNVSEELSTSIPPAHAAKGFEYQMMDDDRHPDGKFERHRTGDLYELVASNDRTHVRPAGQWNDSRLVFRRNHGEHWLNGAKVVDYDLGSARMDAALAASKYKSIPGFAERRRGHIVLQDHGDEVYFRNLNVRELDAAPR